MTYNEPVADFPKPLRAPEGAPNILLVLLDDVGFGSKGCELARGRVGCQ